MYSSGFFWEEQGFQEAIVDLVNEEEFRTQLTSLESVWLLHLDRNNYNFNGLHSTNQR